MELFIQIKNNQPFEHPILTDNFCAAFPDVDINNLPSEFAKFERVKCPHAAGVYEVDVVSYQWVDEVVKDVWSVNPMTPEEIAFKQNEAKENWLKNGYASWVFDEATCAFNPPTPCPTDDKQYQWDEPTTSWIEVQ